MAGRDGERARRGARVRHGHAGITDPADRRRSSGAQPQSRGALEGAGKIRGGMFKGAAIRRAIEGGVARVHVSGLGSARCWSSSHYHGAGTPVTREREDAPAPAEVGS
jgi:hypothetical protein